MGAWTQIRQGHQHLKGAETVWVSAIDYSDGSRAWTGSVHGVGVGTFPTSREARAAVAEYIRDEAPHFLRRLRGAL